MGDVKTILAIVGDYYHRAEFAEEALRKAAGPIEGVSLRFADAERLEAELEARPDAVVLFKEDRLNPQEPEGAVRRWMTPALQERIVRYVEAGGSWVAWHSGLASYDPAGPYVRMLRGHFRYHPEQHQIVRYTGVPGGTGEAGTAAELAPPEPFEILDEHYFVVCDEANTRVFLRSASVDGESVAGWAHRHGRGKVCCLTPAHRPEGMMHDAVADTLRRMLRWCLS
jgi:type 1 glutamine amidotransferase